MYTAQHMNYSEYQLRQTIDPSVISTWDTAVQETYTIDWQEVTRQSMKNAAAWLPGLMDKIYLRYEGYMKLCGHVPVPKFLFWPEQYATSDAYRGCTLASVPTVFFTFRAPPQEFLAVYAVLIDAAEMMNPKPIEQIVKPSKKRHRGAGTEWFEVPEETRSLELDTLYRALDMSCLKERLTQHDVGVLREYIKDVVVEGRVRGANDTKKPKTEENKKRNSKPIYRYGHPLLNEEVLDTVLSMQGVKRNEHLVYAPSRAACMWCFLHSIGIEQQYWPAGQNFPRPNSR